MSTACLLVMTTCPSRDCAKLIAHTLVQQKIAACVHISEVMTSIYQWQGELCEENEYRLQIKCLNENYAALEKTLLILHPYDVPELIALPISHGLTPYFDWIKETTTS